MIKVGSFAKCTGGAGVQVVPYTLNDAAEGAHPLDQPFHRPVSSTRSG